MKSPTDLTGTYIVANNPVSVLSGSSGSRVKTSSGGQEYMIQHIPPIEHLGTSYVLAPFRDRASGYVSRVIATEPNTTIEFTDSANSRSSVVKNLLGDFVENEETSIKAIVADKPVLVVQFAKGYRTDYFGDAFMLIVQPIQAATKEDISFPVTTLATAADVRSYLSITIACDHWNKILVDGQTIDLRVWYYEEVAIAIGQTIYCVFERSYDHGVHHIMSPGHNIPFKAIVYGFSPYYVAYAFTLWGLLEHQNMGEFGGKQHLYFLGANISFVRILYFLLIFDDVLFDKRLICFFKWCYKMGISEPSAKAYHFEDTERFMWF